MPKLRGLCASSLVLRKLRSEGIVPLCIPLHCFGTSKSLLSALKWNSKLLLVIIRPFIRRKIAPVKHKMRSK